MPAVADGMHTPCHGAYMWLFCPFCTLLVKASWGSLTLCQSFLEKLASCPSFLRKPCPLWPLFLFSFFEKLQAFVLSIYRAPLLHCWGLNEKNQSVYLYSDIHHSLYIYFPLSPLLCVFCGLKVCFDLSFALRHTPLHHISTLRGLEGLFLSFWTGFDHRKVADLAVPQGFFKGNILTLDSPILH